MGIFKRPEFIYYEEALEGFTTARKKLNELIENDPAKFKPSFEEYKEAAGRGDSIAMDTIAYYYKSGVPGLMGENYQKYLSWEILAGSRGNELAIEKLQFLFTYAYQEIMDSDKYEDIEYKNDIDEYNAIYVIGKAICKILVRQMDIFPTDMAKEEDTEEPFNQDIYNRFRRTVDQSIPKIIDFMS